MLNSDEKPEERKKRIIRVRVVQSPERKADSEDNEFLTLSEEEKLLIQNYRTEKMIERALADNTPTYQPEPQDSPTETSHSSLIVLEEKADDVPPKSEPRKRRFVVFRKVIFGICACCLLVLAIYLYYEIFCAPVETDPILPSESSSSELSEVSSQPLYNAPTESSHSDKSILEDICAEVNETFSGDDAYSVDCFTDNESLYVHLMIRGLNSTVSHYVEMFSDSIDDYDIWVQAKSSAATVYQSVVYTMAGVEVETGDIDIDIDIFFDLLNDDESKTALYSIENGVVTYDAFTNDEGTHVSTVSSESQPSGSELTISSACYLIELTLQADYQDIYTGLKVVPLDKGFGIVLWLDNLAYAMLASDGENKKIADELWEEMKNKILSASYSVRDILASTDYSDYDVDFYLINDLNVNEGIIDTSSLKYFLGVHNCEIAYDYFATQ